MTSSAFAIVHQMRPSDVELFPVSHDRAEVYVTEVVHMDECDTVHRAIVHLSRKTVEAVGFEVARQKLLDAAFETLLDQAHPVEGGEN